VAGAGERLDVEDYPANPFGSLECVAQAGADLVEARHDRRYWAVRGRPFSRRARRGAALHGRRVLLDETRDLLFDELEIGDDVRERVVDLVRNAGRQGTKR